MQSPNGKITLLEVDTSRGVVVYHDAKLREISKLDLRTNLTEVCNQFICRKKLYNITC